MGEGQEGTSGAGRVPDRVQQDERLGSWDSQSSVEEGQGQGQQGRLWPEGTGSHGRIYVGNDNNRFAFLKDGSAPARDGV